MQLYQLAREKNIKSSSLERAVQSGGIPLESDFNGFFIDGMAEIPKESINLIYLHTNLFGEFPVISLPGINMLALWNEMLELNNEKGLSSLIGRTLKEIPNVADPKISHQELFNVVQFLSCIWVDIRTFSYRYQEQLNWASLVSFETPVYYRNGNLGSWDPSCNILKAEIMETINSTYRLLLCSYGYYRHCFRYPPKKTRFKRKTSITEFPLLQADNEDIYKYPGVSCLDTADSRKVACNLVTTINHILANTACMLLRIPNNRITTNLSKWDSLADDLKWLYKLINKMEAYLNN